MGIDEIILQARAQQVALEDAIKKVEKIDKIYKASAENKTNIKLETGPETFVISDLIIKKDLMELLKSAREREAEKLKVLIGCLADEAEKRPEPEEKKQEEKPKKESRSKIVLTKEIVQKEYTNTERNQKQAAEVIGIKPVTLSDFLKKHPECRQLKDPKRKAATINKKFDEEISKMIKESKKLPEACRKCKYCSADEIDCEFELITGKKNQYPKSKCWNFRPKK